MQAWSIAVFASNEASSLERCLRDLDANCAGTDTRIHLILNGTTDNSIAVARQLTLRHAALRVHLSRLADKANAINAFIHRLRDPGRLSILVDAYINTSNGALEALEAALEANAEAHIASAMPLNGRSAAAMRARLSDGGNSNGNLFAVRSSFFDRMAALDLHIPTFLYRGDGLINSIACHDFDAKGKPWNVQRTIGVAGATYSIRPLSPFRPADVRRQFRRQIRQARGILENHAVKSVIYKSGYAALPRSADQLILDWLATSPPPPTRLMRRWFMWLALRELAVSRDAPAPDQQTFQTVLDRPPLSR